MQNLFSIVAECRHINDFVQKILSKILKLLFRYDKVYYSHFFSIITYGLINWGIRDVKHSFEVLSFVFILYDLFRIFVYHYMPESDLLMQCLHALRILYLTLISCKFFLQRIARLLLNLNMLRDVARL